MLTLLDTLAKNVSWKLKALKKTFTKIPGKTQFLCHTYVSDMALY